MVQWSVVVAFVLTVGRFARLARLTESYIAAGGPAPGAFVCTSDVLWDEIRASYLEYLQIEGS